MRRLMLCQRVFVFVLALSCVILVSSGVVCGQAISGNIVGTVVDPSSALVVNANVEATNLATGMTTSTKTNGTGGYRFENLLAGAYKVTVKASTFKTMTQQTEVVLNQTGTLNFALTPGSESETIEVSAVPPAIDTTSAQISASYNDRYSADLGITSAGGVGAGVLNLSLLSPGVAQASSLGIGTGPSVGGQRPYNNNFTVEGVDNNNKAVTGALIAVPNDAVENFTLLENQFNSDFGHSSGGQFSTTIKSGTNSFHGSVYEYFRNRNLNAIDNVYRLQGLTSNPRFDSNRYGGTFGGPIIKNKLFFFTDYERQPIGLTGTGGAQVSAPTADGLAAISLDPQLSATNFGVFKQYVPVAPSASTCLPYSGAAASASCAANTVPGGQVQISAPAWENFENFVQSADYNISESDQLRGRFVFNKLDQIDTQTQLSAFYQVQPIRFYLFTLGEFHTFTPSLLNEFRVGFNRFNNVTPAGNPSFPGLDAFPNITMRDLGLGIGPDSNAPQFTIQNLYQIVDNISWTKGAHTFKFGVEGREYISPQQFTQRSRGDYIYSAFQLFLRDAVPDEFGERSSGLITYYGNQQALYWYANDTWKFNPHLTLNLGVRYEYTSVPLSEARQALNSLSDTPSIVVPVVNQQLLFHKPQAPKNNWAPRVGFAYSPGNSGNTSVRGGFGLAYDVLYDNIGILGVPPQVGATNDVSSTTPTPFLGNGGLAGGGSGIQVLDEATARASTSNWIPPQTRWPYSINWNLGIQHSFAKDFTVDIRYVGTRGVHLDVQDRINRRSLVSSSAFLPTYLQQPSQAELDGLTTTLAGLQAPGSTIPAYTDNGFASSITADLPLGSSIYHGLQTQVTRRFSKGLMFQAAYTWSRTIDNSTADFFSTSLTPRRPQDFQNWGAERSVSPLSRTHRLTLAAVYDLPYFQHNNWIVKNIVGNWGFSPVYTYESPQWATVQSGLDSNLNGDSAGDRVILNSAGIAGTGSDVTNLCTSSLPAGHLCNGDTDPNFDPSPYVVGYLATNPNAQYIVAGAGARATSSRNTLATRPTNDLSLSTYKNISITERFKIRFGAQFANLFNHPQYIPGSNPGQGLGVNDVTSFTTTANNNPAYLNYLIPGSSIFNNPKAVFPSNARSIALVAKFTF